MQRSMELIHKRSKKVIWLNLLAGYSSYRREVAGMQAAIPFVDLFAPVHIWIALGRWGSGCSRVVWGYYGIVCGMGEL